MRPLGPRIVIVHDFPFFIVDLLALFVAHQQYDSAEEKDGNTPTYPVGPTEFPYRSITWKNIRRKN